VRLVLGDQSMEQNITLCDMRVSFRNRDIFLEEKPNACKKFVGKTTEEVLLSVKVKRCRCLRLERIFPHANRDTPKSGPKINVFLINFHNNVN
jgi:hypothetical protein